MRRCLTARRERRLGGSGVNVRPKLWIDLCLRRRRSQPTGNGHLHLIKIAGAHKALVLDGAKVEGALQFELFFLQA